MVNLLGTLSYVDKGQIDDEVLRTIERQLDLEDQRLRRG
jgi:hypothetical protein